VRSPQDVLIKPLVTEQSINMAQEQHKYSFYVDRDANKIEIKQAVEALFKVHVVAVNTAIVKGKKKKVGRFVGRTSDRKKAIVTVREGDKIEIFEGLLS
jgi:large subunit ribosomal protein L23